jgi:hypothetical protein
MTPPLRACRLGVYMSVRPHMLTPHRSTICSHTPIHAHDDDSATAAAAASATSEGGAGRLDIGGAGHDEGDAFVRMLSEHWEDLFAAEGAEGEEAGEGGVSVLNADELVARIEKGKKARARR